jgi:hypothetical protein
MRDDVDRETRFVGMDPGSLGRPKSDPRFGSAVALRPDDLHVRAPPLECFPSKHA